MDLSGCGDVPIFELKGTVPFSPTMLRMVPAKIGTVPWKRFAELWLFAVEKLPQHVGGRVLTVLAG